MDWAILRGGGRIRSQPQIDMNRALFRTILFAGWAVLPLVPHLAAQRPGEVVPAWSEGTLDIHHINTGKGNATFFLLPDGTSMLVDAGAAGREGSRGVPARPDASRKPGEWIARYVRQMLGMAGRETELDYVILTHFHDDHIGRVDRDAKRSPSGAYVLTGITEVGEHLPIRRIFDRGWPGYDFPYPVRDAMVENYRAFLKLQVEKNGMKVERFQVGRNDQFVLLRAKGKYPNFEIRNVVGNTIVWTGVGNNTRQNWPDFAGLKPEQMPGENPLSLGFRLSYGNFDYGSFGDIPGAAPDAAAPWQDMETPVARAVGPVEALLLDHHGNRDSTNAFFLSSLQPQVVLLHAWAANHPGEDVLHRIFSTHLYPGKRDFFSTNMAQANRDVIGSQMEQMKSQQGHILLRVAPGGESFLVIVLDDSAETFRVKAVFGPYRSR